MSDLTNVGLAQIVQVLAETRYAVGKAVLAVGTGLTAFDPTQTDLLGANQFEKTASNVSTTTTSLIITANFEATEAAFAWNEIGVKSLDDDVLFVRSVPDPAIGVKPENVAWEVTAEVVFSHG